MPYVFPQLFTLSKIGTQQAQKKTDGWLEPPLLLCLVHATVKCRPKTLRESVSQCVFKYTEVCDRDVDRWPANAKELILT